VRLRFEDDLFNVDPKNMDNDDCTYCSIFAFNITYLSNVAVPRLSRQFRRQHDHHSSYSSSSAFTTSSFAWQTTNCIPYIHS